MIDDTRTKQIYEFMVQFTQEHGGVPPSVRTIALGLGISTTSIIFHHIQKLEAMGLVQSVIRTPSDTPTRAYPRNRTWQVAGGTWTPPDVHLGWMIPRRERG